MDFVWRQAADEFGCDLQEMRIRLSRCGYALNALHDDERARRKAEGITSEEEWSTHCRTAGDDWALGKLHAKCGRPAKIVLVHPRGLYAYCAEHVLVDGAVHAKSWMALRIGLFSLEDRSLLDHPTMRKGWYEDAPFLDNFLGALHGFWEFSRTLKARQIDYRTGV